MIINNVLIHFSDVIISSCIILLFIVLLIIMYYIPTIFGIYWAKAKKINPQIMWLMWLFYPGILALIVMRYKWISDLPIKKSFFEIYDIDKEAFLEVKHNIINNLANKTNVIIGIISILLFSLWFVTTGIYNGLRADYLLKNNQLYKAEQYLIYSVINTTIDFDIKTKNYNKAMIICEELKDMSCQNKISKHMYQQEETTPQANLYLAFSNADNYNFK